MVFYKPLASVNMLKRREVPAVLFPSQRLPEFAQQQTASGLH